MGKRNQSHGSTAPNPDRNGGRDPNQLLTVKQLAALWQVSDRTIRRMIGNDEIEVFPTERRFIRIHLDVAKRGPKKSKPSK